MVSLLKVLPALKKRRDTPLLSSGTAGLLVFSGAALAGAVACGPSALKKCYYCFFKSRWFIYTS